jgi:tetratricopeptide (TPR) repeat protein
MAALDCGRIKLAEDCIRVLMSEFPESLRVMKHRALLLEALERYDDALDVLESIIKKDETNPAPRKRKVAILKAKGQIGDAIKELCDYLKKFMSDQEAWHELCNLYLMEGDYNKASFCMEEVLLHNPYSHLIHQRLGDIRYTMGGIDNIETAKSYYAQAIKLNGNNLRALYGLYLVNSYNLKEYFILM